MSPATPVAVEALVLARFDYSETSQTGHLFTRELGRVPVLARGIKKPGPDLRGPLDLFARAEARLLRRRSELWLLTHYRVITGYPGLRLALPRLRAACHLGEILRAGTRDLDPAPGLFDLTRTTLALLERANASTCQLLQDAFRLGYLQKCGFLPAFERCVRCGREAPPKRPVRFFEAEGGILCRACAGEGRRTCLQLSWSERRYLRALLLEKAPSDLLAFRPGPAEQRCLHGLFTRLLTRVLERELKSGAFLG